jgi:Holliday junction resolvase
MVREVDKDEIRRWRKRGFYSESALVKLLTKNGYNAVRVPVSNPSLNPLPDVIARKDLHVYAFEVKNARYYAYFPKQQIEKLFRFLHELIPMEKQYKHAVLGAHLGKRWVFKEISWKDWEKKVVMPKLNKMGNISKWYKKEGDVIKKGEPLLEVTSENVPCNLKAPASGVLKKILVGESGDTPANTVLALISKVPEKIRILKRDRGDFDLKKGS